MGRQKFNLTERNIHYALDYNCNTGRALASGLYRPLWRRSDSSSARDCRHCARYSAPSRQTALSQSVFAPVVSGGRASSQWFGTGSMPLWDSFEKRFYDRNSSRHLRLSVRYVLPSRVSEKKDLKLIHSPLCRIHTATAPMIFCACHTCPRRGS